MRSTYGGVIFVVASEQLWTIIFVTVNVNNLFFFKFHFISCSHLCNLGHVI